MNAPRDPDRLIHAFLREGEELLQDPIYDAVRAQIDAKRQRAFIGPWRIPSMNRFLVIGAAAFSGPGHDRRAHAGPADGLEAGPVPGQGDVVAHDRAPPVAKPQASARLRPSARFVAGQTVRARFVAAARPPC